MTASLGPFDHFHDAPPLLLRQRTRFHDADRVARVCDPRLVVRVVLLRPHDLLAIEPISDPALDRYDDGLVHLVAHHRALAELPTASGLVFHASPRLRVLLRELSLTQDRLESRHIPAQEKE